ncbi:hypothetical protein COV28_01515 [candidate division WWE3 bacterium CG10_big_fil_rev_8_21_14_0_10_48_23]|nr:MAG: hypothetical protein COX85_03060 [Candidatus Micrarchaeota archaeon CG_4_10_14_0_2_um_filter_55_9]PJE51916.1 MAG: hypothetical protein COV28_01515 [candidate division WWE3 bacterium CG10_big_fil_rev_8_21_14_0_10_48_23]
MGEIRKKIAATELRMEEIKEVLGGLLEIAKESAFAHPKDESAELRFRAAELCSSLLSNQIELLRLGVEILELRMEMKEGGEEAE